MDEFDLQSMLSQILDDAAPLPTAPTAAAPAPQPATITTPEPEPKAEQPLADATGTSEEAEPATQVCNPPEEATAQAAPADVFFTDVPPAASKAPTIKMPVFTAEDFAETTDIRNFAMLAVLNTARWHAKARDRQGARDIGAANEAKDTAFEVKKHLLAGADTALKNIHRIIDEARATHYDMTLPWSTTSLQDKGKRTGARLLPNSLFEDYVKAMHGFKERMDAAIKEFVPAYPAMVEEAKKHLGKRFDAGEYPNPSSIAGHFDLSFDFQPLPKGEDFKGLPGKQLQALAEKINANTRKMAENAMQDLWHRVYEAVSHMAERLSSPDKTFHASMIDNIRGVAGMMEHLNITSDPRMEQLRQKIVKHLCPHEAKALRENPVLRQKVGAMAVSILQEMQS